MPPIITPEKTYPEFEKLKRSIEQFGYVDLVIFNKATGTVVGGHQRLKVLEKLGYEEIDCVVVDLGLEQSCKKYPPLTKVSEGHCA